MNENVFINCPFDDGYRSKLMAILFVVVYLGYRPRISLENMDSSRNRLAKIQDLIRTSELSIHDLSRLKADASNQTFRGNMPFELGMDFGYKFLSDPVRDSKRILVMEKERYSIQKAISDLNGFDIESHEDDSSRIMEIVRNWLNNVDASLHAVAPSSIWDDYTTEFNEWYFWKATAELKYKPDEFDRKVPIDEYVKLVQEWCAEHVAPRTLAI
jgi:hypothetical protein